MGDAPKPVEQFVAATNSADEEAFLDAFTPDATLDDWGRKFSGRSGIASWNRTDNIGVQSRMKIVSVEPAAAPDAYVVTIEVSGNGYNGTGPMTFTLAGDLIADLTIAPTS